MKILEYTDNEARFNISEAKQVRVLDLSREDLFKIMENIYDDKLFYDMSDIDTIVEAIKNPVEKEITTQIIEKIQEFSEHVDDLKASLSSKYPEADS